MSQAQFKKYLKDVMDEKGLTVEEGNKEKQPEKKAAVSEKVTPIATKRKGVDEAKDKSKAKTSAVIGTKKVEEVKAVAEETKKVVKAMAGKPKLKEEISQDTVLILEALNRLIDKVDVLINTAPPEIVVPTPIVKLSVPEGNKTVVKRIERDERGLIKQIIEEPESLLEHSVVTSVEKDTIKEDSTKKTTKRKNK